MLAPVRNDRISAGKTPAATAGFVVSRHAGAVVGREMPAMNAVQEDRNGLQGGYPPAPSAGAGSVERRSCLVSSLTDSRTR